MMHIFFSLWIVLWTGCDAFTLVNTIHPSMHRWSLFAIKASVSTAEGGLYRPFAEQAWNYLLEQNPSLLSVLDLPSEVSFQETTVPPKNHTVRISLRAAVGSDAASPIQYVRSALIETIGNDDHSTDDGIQVLNMVVFPKSHAGWPVWGADFVSLPGNKHLLLLDAQPVYAMGDGTAVESQQNPYEQWFDTWYERHEVGARYPWGGDLPEAVQEFVSARALWTRLGAVPNAATATKEPIDQPSTTSPIRFIQESVFPAALDHLSIYLESLLGAANDAERRDDEEMATNSRLPRYLQYRLDNDPARPMLKRLFGPEWTEEALHDVLFPIHKVLPSVVTKE
jgi:Ferredoxin-dependent bilin reductase